MLLSLALILIVGLASAGIVKKLKLPRIIGMLISGAVMGPYVLNLLDPSILGISSELRSMALIIILLKAGLSLNISDLKKVGRPAVLMSFLPACFEILAAMVFAPIFLHTTLVEGAVIGAVLGAVSPAVVVPMMVFLIDNKYGTEKGIPQMILAGASLDDVFVIVLFSTFCAIAGGETAGLKDFINIPVKIVLGIVIGIVAGILFHYVLNLLEKIKFSFSVPVLTLVMLGTGLLLNSAEDGLKAFIPFSGLLAVMTMTMAYAAKCSGERLKSLKDSFGSVWVLGEVLLFVLVGAAVDIRYSLEAGLSVIALIFVCLFIRSIGVWISLLGTKLNTKERIFTVISYLPKATVQAAIGGVPLSMGLPCGKLVLTVAVVSIILTAPLGAFGMEITYKKLLEDNK